MAKLTIKLKQHTPIIHFQHDQKGATLRASELKPKLDKFLIGHAFNNDFEHYKKYLIGWNEKKKQKDYNDKKPLDYKIKIQGNYTYQGNKIEPNRQLYFGNIGSGEKKYSVFEPNNEPVIIDFFSFNYKIINVIKNKIASFFAITNFGTRQNKGFGSFYIEPQDINYKDFITILKSTLNFFLYFKCGNHNNYNKKFENISVIYNLMKSGINFPDFNNNGDNAFYFKSYLFQYYNGKGIGNEKHFIKEKFFRPFVRILDDGLPKKYLRAMLGVCDGIDFKDKERRGKIFYKSEVERFMSPITFKIVGNHIIMIPEMIPEKMKNLNYTFTNTFRSRNGEIENTKNISTPNNFDLSNFLKGYADYYNSLDISNLDGKKGRFVDMVRSAKNYTISIYEGATNE